MDYQEVNYSPNPNAEELDQLNLDTTSETWGNNRPVRDPRALGALGNEIISTPETTPVPIPETTQATTLESIQTSPESTIPGVVETPLVMPQDAERESTVLNSDIISQPDQTTPDIQLALDYAPSDIQTVDDSLTPAGEKALKNLTTAFEKGKIPLDDFYERGRDFSDLNLGNSYADREASRQRIQEKQANTPGFQGVGN